MHDPRRFTRWQRLVLIEYACHHCEQCGRYLSRRHPPSVHHVVPLSQGGASTASNGRVLCWKCHRAIHEPGRAA